MREDWNSAAWVSVYPPMTIWGFQMLDFPTTTWGAVALARILDRSHQLISFIRLADANIPTPHTASKCFYTPTHQTSLDVPWGRRRVKQGTRGEQVTLSRMIGRLPLCGGLLLFLWDRDPTGLGTKQAIGTGVRCVFRNVLVLCALAWPSTGVLGAPLDTPVEYVIVLVSFTDEEIPKELSQVRVVRLVVEPQSPSVVQKDGKLVGEAATEKIGGCGHLFLHDPVVLLLLGGSLETLPGERTTEEVHEDISERFEVIAAGLLNTQVSIDGGVASGPG